MSLSQEEVLERRKLIMEGHNAHTSSRLDYLNRKLNRSKSDSEIKREYYQRSKDHKPVGQLSAEMLRRGLKF